jgi:hypothetical protein
MGEQGEREGDPRSIRFGYQGALSRRGRPEARRHALFETLVRVHRAGEGEPFTGLKPPGTIDPAFQAADKALREGAVDALAVEIAKSVQDGIRNRFAEVIEKKKHADDSTEAGRAYVAAYIEYAHFVEAIHTIASAGAGSAITFTRRMNTTNRIPPRSNRGDAANRCPRAMMRFDFMD